MADADPPLDLTQSHREIAPHVQVISASRVRRGDVVAPGPEPDGWLVVAGIDRIDDHRVRIRWVTDSVPPLEIQPFVPVFITVSPSEHLRDPDR